MRNGFCQLGQKPSEDFIFDSLRKLFMVAPLDVEPKIENVFGESDIQPRVQTTSGLIHGITTKHDHSFYGIPYAKPPVGELRFQPPQPLVTPSAIRNKTHQDILMCYQIGFFLNRDEDCLILDIHVPSHVDLSDRNRLPNRKLPVMFSIHGGGFILGSGTWPVYEGRYLSEATNTIVVEINYRLGPFGFLAYNNGKQVLDGNQGFKDQQLALQWVQDNIEQFGGDKNKITIFGESAGGQSVMLHLLSDVSDSLFHQAIIQSNPFPCFYPTYPEAHAITKQVIEYLRCGIFDFFSTDCCLSSKDGLDCLKEASSQKLVNAMMKVMAEEFSSLNFFQFIEPFRPVIDGVEFTKQPIQLFKEGRWQKHKPIMIGTNSQELALLQFLWPFMTENIYKGFNDAVFEGYGIHENTGELVSNKYIETYGPTNLLEVLGIEMTDLVFGCPQRALARYASSTSESVVYFYMFNHSLDGPDCENNFGSLCGLSNHAVDLYFVYRTINHSGMVADTEDIRAMDQFSNYWGNFATTGKPSEDFKNEFIEWLPYAHDDRNKAGSWLHLMMEENSTYHVSDFNKDVCDFWDSQGIYMDVPGVSESQSRESLTLSEKIFSAARSSLFRIFD
ncbi:crystal protein-like [Styela clava]